MNDIRLATAVIAWTVPMDDGKAIARRVKVFSLRDRRANEYQMTHGACSAIWQNEPDKRMPLLLLLFRHLVVGFGFTPAEVDNAFKEIAEYRAIDETD